MTKTEWWKAYVLAEDDKPAALWWFLLTHAEVADLCEFLLHRNWRIREVVQEIVEERVGRDI